MSITIHFMHPHPEGSIKTDGSQLPFWDASSGAPMTIVAQPRCWRVACGLLLKWFKQDNHVCTPDPKAANCAECKKTKAYADAMKEREGPPLERIPVEMADAKPAPGEGRPERPVAHAGARKPG